MIYLGLGVLFIMTDFSIQYVERLTRLEAKLDDIQKNVSGLKEVVCDKVCRHDIEIESAKIKMRYLIGTVIALSTAVGYSPLTQLLK